MRFTRTDYHEHVEDDSEIQKDFEKRLAALEENRGDDISNYIQARFSDPKLAIKSTVDDLARRTGLVAYINMVNAELEGKTKTAEDESDESTDERQEPKSLLDIPKIKGELDNALVSNKEKNYIDILNILQDLVSVDDDIPEDLKGVFTDKRLIDYIKQRKDDGAEAIDYSGLNGKKHIEDPNTSNPTSSSYFNFNTSSGDGI